MNRFKEQAMKIVFMVAACALGSISDMFVPFCQWNPGNCQNWTAEISSWNGMETVQ